MGSGRPPGQVRMGFCPEGHSETSGCDRPCSGVVPGKLGVKHSPDPAATPCTRLTSYFTRMSLSRCSCHREHEQVVGPERVIPTGDAR